MASFTTVEPVHADDWDQHWLAFSATSEKAPATLYRRRLAFELLAVDPRDHSARMLEIGSGTGCFALDFNARYPHCRFLGVDLSRAGVELSSQRLPSATFIQRNLLEPAAADQRLDYRATHALCSEVLEHIDDPALLLRHAAEYMAPGCKLVVTVPGGRRNAFDEHIGHRRHFTTAQLRDLLEHSGFEVEHTYGAGFPFFNLYRVFTTLRGRRLIQDVSGKPSWLVQTGSLVFGALFHFNLRNPWGWQTVAVARYRGE